MGKHDLRCDGDTTVRNRLAPQICITLMASLAVLFAADKPIWKLDTQAQGIPKMWIDRPVESSRYSAVRLQISPDNEVIISFFQRRRQRELATKTTPEKSGSIFVSLFIDKDDGGLITKSEWPVIGESVWWERGSIAWCGRNYHPPKGCCCRLGHKPAPRRGKAQPRVQPSG